MQMKRSHLIGIGAAAVALLVVLCFVFVSRRNAEPPVEAPVEQPVEQPPKQDVPPVVTNTSRSAPLSQKGAEKSAEKPLSAGGTNKTAKAAIPLVRGRIDGADDDVFRDENGKPYPQKDQELMRRVRDAGENEDLESALALAAEAASSPNDELREMVVDTLSDFGKDALAELTQYMADANEEIADKAKDGWMSGVQDIEDDGAKAGVVEATMKTINNPDFLEDVANELTDIDQLVAIQTLANIIEDCKGKNDAAVSAAKEAYTTITDKEWSGVDAAEAWLQKNYEPDDDD